MFTYLNLRVMVYVFKLQNVCKLNKILYGLKQVPREWYENLKSTLLQWGFKSPKSDFSLFYLYKRILIIFILLYVDDILVTGSHKKTIEKFVEVLDKTFYFKDIGDLKYFLCVEVIRDNSGIYLTQAKYISDLLERLNFLSHLKPCNTPAGSSN